MRYLLALTLAAMAAAQSRRSQPSVERLLESTAAVRAMTPEALAAMVPLQAGLHFVGCPNCNGGRQEGQLAWSFDRPDEVYCRYCQHRYPSAKYPMNKAVEVKGPNGAPQRYPYWEDDRGYRWFFAARRDDLAREYLAERTRELGLLYAATKDPAHARRAAAVLTRFAEVFPGWAFHYDYPFQQKQIYDGPVDAARFRPGYRTARWTWWAYMDIPRPLVEAFGAIKDSGALSPAAREKVEYGLIRNAAEQALANPETYHNMGPTLWSSMVGTSHALGDPRYADEARRRLREMMATRFLYDGAWHEGAPSYHRQTIGNMRSVYALLGDALPAELEHSQAVLDRMRLPDGRPVPVHDTWYTDSNPAPAESRPYLLPALGHAMLGGGRGLEQTQLHLTWSGSYGHSHGDHLSLLLWTAGREALSDVGYTHSKHRAWTLATAGHNTVVIDGEQQSTKREVTDGVLRYFDVSAPDRQVVSASGESGYPGKARVYRRTIALRRRGPERWYAVDFFEVEGGRTHDYFLHGAANGTASVSAAGRFSPVASLLPSGTAWREAANEGDVSMVERQWFAYGYLRDLRSGAAAGPVTFRADGAEVRVHLLPEPGSMLMLGNGPGVRCAEEDDRKLDGCKRPFLMLRHEGGKSLFLAVIEPVVAGAPALQVTRGSGPEIVVRDGDRTETWSLAGLEGQTVRADLRGVGDGFFDLSGPAPAAGTTVRVVTADGHVYPFVAAGSSGQRLRVEGRQPFRMDAMAGTLELTSYPQRVHKGPVTVDWRVTSR